MDLVGYSDSEESDNESKDSLPEKSKLTRDIYTSTTKANFHKVVDRKAPNKIRVSLPNNEDVRHSDNGNGEPPAKKVRTTGAMSGFNSMLPAPKNAAKTSANLDGVKKSRGSGLGVGINLKTGANPAFSREPELEQNDEQDGAGVPKVEAVNGVEETYDLQNDVRGDANYSPSAQLEKQFEPKRMTFKPLSVARKSQKKQKNHTNGRSSSNVTLQTGEGSQNKSTTALDKTQQLQQSTPKMSLFSGIEDGASQVEMKASSGRYKPLLEQTNQDDFEVEESIADPVSKETRNPVQPKTTTDAQNLNSLADSMNLTAAQRRQLFGRKSKADDARVSQFSVSTEYSENSNMIANEGNAAPQHNPVRSIAPGKHSLQQLLNSANTQRDALEESFATGKRNKKEAGNRYGW